MAKEVKEQVEQPQEVDVVKHLAELTAENNDLKRKLGMAIERINVLETNDFFLRLDWLWKTLTLEGAEKLFGKDFFDARLAEFKQLMTPQQKEKD